MLKQSIIQISKTILKNYFILKKINKLKVLKLLKHEKDKSLSFRILHNITT